MLTGLFAVLHRLASYFVIFWKFGFTPNELRYAQQAGSMFTRHRSFPELSSDDVL